MNNTSINLPLVGTLLCRVWWLWSHMYFLVHSSNGSWWNYRWQLTVQIYTIYGITFGFWIMATQNTCLFSYSYLIQLLMWPTLKVLKHVNCHLHSSKKFTNETGKTLRDHFWCGIWKFNTLFSIIYSWYHPFGIDLVPHNLWTYSIALSSMDLIHYSYTYVVLFNFPCVLGSQPCYLLFANGAGGVEYFFIAYFSWF